MQKKYILTASAVVVLATAALVSLSACAEDNKGVAARVNGEVITIDDIKKGYDNNPQIASQVEFDKFYEKAVDIYVRGKLIYQAAEAVNVEDTPEYKEQLQTAKEDLARKVYLEKILATKVSDAEIKKIYDEEYLKNFKAQKEIKAKHILVADEKTANEIIKKLNNGGNFDQLAKQYSKDTPELGYFTADTMVPEFSKAAFAMKKGAYSKTPVKTQFGYHIIEVEDIRDSSPLALKDVEPQIKNLLSQQTLAETFDNLYKNAKIEIYNLNGSKMVEPKPAEN